MKMIPRKEENTRRDRAVSVTTGFIINLGIATTLIALMFFLFQGVFAQVQDDTAGSEMRVVGEKVSSELQKADRLAQQGDGEIEIDLPSFEQSYSLNIEETDDGNGEITVNSGSVEVTVGYSVQSDVRTEGGVEEYTRSSGSTVVLDYDSENEEVVLR